MHVIIPLWSQHVMGEWVSVSIADLSFMVDRVSKVSRAGEEERYRGQGEKCKES